jgi:hypothetical protein
MAYMSNESKREIFILNGPALVGIPEVRNEKPGQSSDRLSHNMGSGDGGGGWREYDSTRAIFHNR